MDKLINELFGKGKTTTEKAMVCDQHGISFEDYAVEEFKHVCKLISVNKTNVYAYFITFTLKPDADANAAEALIRGTVERKSALQIRKLDMVKEHTKLGQAHWHVYIETLKPLKKDRFNYYIKKCGNIDIKKAKSSDVREIENYMMKEADEIVRLI